MILVICYMSRLRKSIYNVDIAEFLVRVMTFELLTIDPAQQWKFEDFDSGKTWAVSGKQVREEGFQIAIRTAAIPGSSFTRSVLRRHHAISISGMVRFALLHAPDDCPVEENNARIGV